MRASSGQGPPCSRPCRTSAWSRSGTTATTATASSTPPTPSPRSAAAARPGQVRLPGGGLELHRRGGAPRGDRLGPAAPAAQVRCGAAPAGGTVRGRTSRGTKAARPPGCPRSPGSGRGTDSSRGRCSCRAPGGLRAAGWPAHPVVRRPAARSAPATGLAVDGAAPCLRVVRASPETAGTVRSAATAAARAAVAARRTAEELGRAFPARWCARPAGASAGHRRRRARTRGGDAWRRAGGRGRVRRRAAARRLALARPDLRTGRRCAAGWAPFRPHLRPGRAGGRGVADSADPWSRRWSAGTRPASPGARWKERRSAHLPPASRLATITGSPGAVDDALTLLARPDKAELLGPAPVEGDRERCGPWSVSRARSGTALSDALGELQRLRSARRSSTRCGSRSTRSRSR